MGWSEPKKFGIKKYNLGTGTSFKIPKLIEDGTLPSTIDYTKLTIDNFIIGASKVSWTQSSTVSPLENTYIKSGNRTPSVSYDDSTGELTITNNTQKIYVYGTTSKSNTHTSTLTLTMNVWLIC